MESLQASQKSAEEDGSIHRGFFRWLDRLLAKVNQTDFISEVRYVDISSDDVANFFDTDGLGVRGKRFFGWALCNGSNGTRNLAGKIIRASVTAAGGAGDVSGTAATYGYVDLVAIMKVVA